MVGPTAQTGVSPDRCFLRILRRFRPVLPACGLSLMLAACASGTATTTPAPVIATVTAPQRITPPPPTRPFLSVGQLLSLKDLASDTVIARLGKPDSTRSEPPAEIWIYRSETCVLDIFLFTDGPGLKVLHTVTRNRQQAPRTEKNTCSPFTPGNNAV